MKVIISNKPARVIKAKKHLQEKLNIKISTRGREITIDGRPEDEYIAEKVLEAIGFGFPFDVSLLIKEEDFMFEVLSIKDYTKRKDLGRIKARIIGTKGKTLKTLADLTNCFFELKDNEIGIIGPPEYIENAQDAVIHLIKGAKQGNVYAFLEKHQIQPISDLGLKEKKKK